MKWFYWIYGIDLTKVISPIFEEHNPNDVKPDFIALENDLKYDHELTGNIILIEERTEYNDPQHYIGIALAEWAEIEERPTKPTEELIPEQVKEEVNKLIKRIQTNWPFLSSKVECIPKVFLSMSDY